MTGRPFWLPRNDEACPMIARALQVTPGRLDELLTDGLTARSNGTGRLLMPSGGGGIRLQPQPEDEHGGRPLRELASCEADPSVARVITLHAGITGLASANPVADTVPRQRGKPGSGMLLHLRDRLEASKADDGIRGQAAALPAVLDILAFVNEVARTAGPEIRGQFSPRDVGYFQSWMAASLALAGYPESSARIVLASAERADQLGSNRTRSELQRVHALLQPWRNRPSVRELQATVK